MRLRSGQIGALVLFAWCATQAMRAQVPSTDIYLATVKFGRFAFHVENVANITNRAGYDNQPSFTPDGNAILFTSIMDDGQADIYRYDLTSGKSERVTRTRESEYSPCADPSGVGFSVVRVEADSTQRLWQFDLNGERAHVLLPDIRPVGYYTWITRETVAVFVLGQPNTLQLASVRSGTSTIVEKSIGRSLHSVPAEQAVSFVHKVSDSVWVIKRYEAVTGKIESIVPTLRGSEDYCWLSDKSLLMGRGSKLYRWTGSDGWHEVADLASYGMNSITRLASNRQGTHIAIVAIPSGQQ